jgi:endonuclease/exonuclease/phosphatase family metal-dependent hydrolase
MQAGGWHGGWEDGGQRGSTGSIQLRVEVEVVPPSGAHAMAAGCDDEPAGRGGWAPAELSVEGAPLLGGTEKRPGAVLGFEQPPVAAARWQLWRRCSLVQCGASVAVSGTALLGAFALSRSVPWPVLMLLGKYLLGAALLVGLFISCIRLRAARRPVVVNAATTLLRADCGGHVRLLALNMCLLPAGINFSGKYLCDGDDRKAERLGKLLQLMDNYDIVLLNELWGSPWSGHHGRFTAAAGRMGFNVVTDPIGMVSNTGNMILSRFPLRDASSIIFQNHAGWQSMVPNGALHATTQLPSGEPLHLFTTHLQCTTAPPEAIRPPASPSAVDAVSSGMLDLLERGEKVTGGQCDSVRKRQLMELKAFMDSVVPTSEDKYLLGGDMNIEGGSPEYMELTKMFGRQTLNAPDFVATYNTDSFLTPPGWRGVEYSVCLDHIISNLQVLDFKVLADDISDHRGLTVIFAPPQPVTSPAAGAPDPLSDECAGGIGSFGGAVTSAWRCDAKGQPLSPCTQMSQSVEALSRALESAEDVDSDAAQAAENVPTVRQNVPNVRQGAVSGVVRPTIEI